jgi:hypothetical protein
MREVGFRLHVGKGRSSLYLQKPYVKDVFDSFKFYYFKTTLLLRINLGSNFDGSTTCVGI